VSSASTDGAGQPGGVTRPTKVVVVLLDSLRSDALARFGGGRWDTPVLDRLTAHAVRFRRHVSGSLPCMPARHDLLCGALDFLWKPWGSIELWEEPITAGLRRAGVTTMLVSDHPHLFETGGENYHTEFSAWDYLRGHESDPWRTVSDPSWTGTPALPARSAPRHARPYDLSRTWLRTEEEFPGPRTMAAAARWLRDEAPAHDRWVLVIDEFDPHEPFDTPEPWASRYDADWEGERIIWPPYAVGARRDGRLSNREADHLLANYGAKVSMIDHHLGRVLAEVSDDVVVIVGTDHGHYFGDHDLDGADVWGKPATTVTHGLVHTPLLVRWPGHPGGDVDALTTTVDIHATLCDVFAVTPEHRTHGVSLVPLIEGSATSVRDWALFGYWGREVNVTDGEHVYCRSPRSVNEPLSMWSNRWSTMPVHSLPDLRLPRPDDRAWLDRMPGSTVPVIRQPFATGDPLPFWAYGVVPGRHGRYELSDTASLRPAADGDGVELVAAALEGVDAPAEQFERLGLVG
jgi:arylsulfatase A-like enzyme